MAKLENDTTGIRTIRGLESRLGALKAQLSLEKQKREQAEQELAATTGQLETALETRGKIAPRTIPKRGKGKRGGQATAILCCNDWHVEGCVTKESVSGANEFNLEIASRRIGNTWQKALKYLDANRTVSNIDNLVVWLGGDLINGTIHEELEESNFLGPTEAVLFLQDHVASGIDLLRKESGCHITVATSFGNHGRTTRRRRISTGYRHSWEWLSYSNLAHYYRNTPGVSFKVERGYHNYLDVQGYTVRFHHGDAIKYAGGVGGVTIPLKKKIAQWNKQRRAHLDVLGHFHQFIDGWDFVVCGCLIGLDAYAVDIGAECQRPTQTLIVIDREYGKVMTVPLFCE